MKKTFYIYGYLTILSVFSLAANPAWAKKCPYPPSRFALDLDDYANQIKVEALNRTYTLKLYTPILPSNNPINPEDLVIENLQDKIQVNFTVSKPVVVKMAKDFGYDAPYQELNVDYHLYTFTFDEPLASSTDFRIRKKHSDITIAQFRIAKDLEANHVIRPYVDTCLPPIDIRKNNEILVTVGFVVADSLIKEEPFQKSYQKLERKTPLKITSKRRVPATVNKTNSEHSIGFIVADPLVKLRPIKSNGKNDSPYTIGFIEADPLVPLNHKGEMGGCNVAGNNIGAGLYIFVLFGLLYSVRKRKVIH